MRIDKALLKDFHDQVYAGYRSVLFGDKNVLYKMKELWFYLIQVFSEGAPYVKRIRKSERLSDYDEAVSRLFREQELLSDKV